MEFVDVQESFDIFNLSGSDDLEVWHEYNAHVFSRSAMAKYVIPHLRNWDFNRCINIEHKNKIKDILYQQQMPIIHGEICVVCDTNYRMLVINGQHRLSAIEEIINERPTYNIKLKFCIIQINDIDNITSDSRVVYDKIKEIYKIINDSLPTEPYPIKEPKATEIADKMVEHEKLKTGIVKHPKGMTVRKPCIAYKELRDVIARLLPDDCSRIDADLFLIRAIGKNEEFSEMSAERIYDKSNPSAAKMAHLEKARTKKFYLNLDSKIATPEFWIRAILAGI